MDFFMANQSYYAYVNFLNDKANISLKNQEL
jgi:hypothetical protein